VDTYIFLTQDCEVANSNGWSLK